MAISTKTQQTNRDAPTAAPHIASAAVLESVLLRVRLRARRRAAWLHTLRGVPGPEHIWRWTRP